MRSVKNIRNFNIIGKPLTAAEGGSFTHAVNRTRKAKPADATSASNPKYDYTWFLKLKKASAQHLPPLVEAELETVAQEFFRFFIQTQPKTRVGMDSSNVYVLSKEVPGFRQFITDEMKNNVSANLANGTFTGLGDIVVLALLMDEHDLKDGNMGVNEHGKIVKIDGDWCFSALRKEKRNSQITESIIAALPFKGTYGAHNWINERHGIEIDPSVGSMPHIRKEINQALLRVILMTSEFVDVFVEAYVNDSQRAAIITNEVCSKLMQLRKAALANKSFQDYLKTPEAKEHLETHIARIKTFKTTQKNYLIADLPTLESDIRHQFDLARAFLAGNDHFALEELKGAHANLKQREQILISLHKEEKEEWNVLAKLGQDLEAEEKLASGLIDMFNRIRATSPQNENIREKSANYINDLFKNLTTEGHVTNALIDIKMAADKNVPSPSSWFASLFKTKKNNIDYHAELKNQLIKKIHEVQPKIERLKNEINRQHDKLLKISNRKEAQKEQRDIAQERANKVKLNLVNVLKAKKEKKEQELKDNLKDNIRKWLELQSGKSFNPNLTQTNILIKEIFNDIKLGKEINEKSFKAKLNRLNPSPHLNPNQKLALANVIKAIDNYKAGVEILQPLNKNLNPSELIQLGSTIIRYCAKPSPVSSPVGTHNTLFKYMPLPASFVSTESSATAAHRRRTPAVA